MSEQILNGEVASVGELGTTVRGDRIYHNAQIYHQNSAEVRDIMNDLLAQVDGERVSRAVFRGIMSAAVMHDVMASDLADLVEVALPLANYGEAGWLAYISFNSPGREPLVAVPKMVAETSGYQVPENFDAQLLPSEFIHRNQIPTDAFSQLEELWQPFEWDVNGVQQRAGKVSDNLQRSGLERDTWFSGLWHGDRLVCAATAERLTYQGANGPFDLVESTEWSTCADFRRKGKSLMAHNLWRLNRQILEDLSTTNKTPLIFAETNYMTRADKAGRRAGFVIPTRDYAAQMVLQNVVVNDGLTAEVSWRDFTFLTLPVRVGEQ